MNELDRLIGWFRKRVSIEDFEEYHLKFIMAEYAKIYHEEQVKNSVVLADVSNCSCINRDTLTPEARKMFDDIDKALERKK